MTLRKSSLSCSGRWPAGEALLSGRFAWHGLTMLILGTGIREFGCRGARGEPGTMDTAASERPFLLSTGIGIRMNEQCPGVMLAACGGATSRPAVGKCAGLSHADRARSEGYSGIATRGRRQANGGVG
jgi:hypothetical protein